MVCAEPAEPAELDERKKVAINLVDARAFSYAQTPITKSVTTTPVSGIGDHAVYATLPGVTLRPGYVPVCQERGFVLHRSCLRLPGEAKARGMEKTLTLEVLAKL